EDQRVGAVDSNKMASVVPKTFPVADPFKARRVSPVDQGGVLAHVQLDKCLALFPDRRIATRDPKFSANPVLACPRDAQTHHPLVIEVLSFPDGDVHLPGRVSPQDLNPGRYFNPDVTQTVDPMLRAASPDTKRKSLADMRNHRDTETKAEIGNAGLHGLTAPANRRHHDTNSDEDESHSATHGPHLAA